MRYLTLVALLTLVAVPLYAGGEFLPVEGWTHLRYDMATGQITPAGPSLQGLSRNTAHASSCPKYPGGLGAAPPSQDSQAGRTGFSR